MAGSGQGVATAPKMTGAFHVSEMRTLFVHERFGALGEAEANILLTAGELRRRGHVIGILHGPGTGIREDDWREVFSRCFAMPRRGGFNSVQSALWEFSPDLLYVHGVRNLQVIEMLGASGIPLVRMVNEREFGCGSGSSSASIVHSVCRHSASACRAYFGKRKERWLSQKCDRMLVPSNALRDQRVRRQFPAEKIEVLVPVRQPHEPGIQSNFSDRNLIVYSGPIVRGRGLDAVLESLARVNAPFECAIIGDGSYRTYCEQLSRSMGLQNKVSFKGFITPGEMKEYYREATVALVTSIWPEPFGSCGLEPMRYGVPGVGFDTGGINEWLLDGYNGCLAPATDKGAFAVCVERLLLDKDRARMLGENSRRLLSTHFDFSEYIRGLESCFEQVLTGIRERAAV